MNIEKMREEFEAWQCDADGGPQTDPMWMNRIEGGNGDYGITEVQRDWITWQASRAAIEIIAPDDGMENCQEQWGAQCKNTFDCGYNFASSRYDQVIEAAGIKVKT